VVKAGCHTQRRRVLSFFSCRRNWDSPNPSPASEFIPPPFGTGGRGTLAGGGRVPIPTRGHTLWHCIFVFFVVSCYRESTPSEDVETKKKVSRL
jgi:hypothetical protein